MSDESDAFCAAPCREDVALIRDSGLFDVGYYRRERGMHTATVDTLIGDYILNWRTAKVNPAAHLDGAAYQKNVGGACDKIAPLLHFVKYGIHQGRNPWTQAAVLNWQSAILDDADLALAMIAKTGGTWPKIAPGASVTVHVHPQSHIVFHEFQSMIVAGFRRIGVAAEPAQHRFEGSPALRIIIAPHDFFYLEPLIDPAQIDLGACVLFNTEQIPSHWFGRCYRFLRAAAGVLDINLQSAACLAQLGMPTRFLPIGRIQGYPLFDDLLPISREYTQWAETDAGGWINADQPLDARPIDILWIGSSAKRRKAFWEGAKPLFDRHASFVRLVDVRGALKADHPDAISGLAFAALARQSKILLNVHHFDTPYFEWQRLMHFGFFQGACVVTETASRVPGLMPDTHYLQTGIAQIPELVDWLLRAPEGRHTLEQVRARGQAEAGRIFDLPRTLESLFMAR